MKKSAVVLGTALLIVFQQISAFAGVSHRITSFFSVSALDGSPLSVPPALGGRKPRWRSRDEYDSFQAFVREQDAYSRIPLIQAFIQRFPDSDFISNAYVAEMQTYAQLGETSSAIGAAERVLTTDPDNLLALAYLSFTFPYTFNVADPNPQEELSQGARDAQHGLQVLQSMQKPKGMRGAQFEKTIKTDRATFNVAVGFAAIQQKNYSQAIKSLEAARQDKPDDVLAYSLLGQAYYDKTPREADRAIWNLARATNLAEASNSPNAAKLRKFYIQVYEAQQGSSVGEDQVLAQAGTSGTMPAHFKVAPRRPAHPSEGLPAASGAARLGATHDFRKADWGMTVGQVEATESGKPLHLSDSAGEHVIDYQGDIAGFRGTLIAYFFVVDKLVRAKYIFTEDHTNDDDYISDFDQVKQLLIEKYGKPSGEEKNWKSDDDEQEFRDHEGLAVATGSLSFITDWTTPASHILEGLLGDNYSVDFQVEYDSLALEKLDNEARQKAGENQF